VSPLGVGSGGGLGRLLGARLQSAMFPLGVVPAVGLVGSGGHGCGPQCSSCGLVGGGLGR